MSRRPQIPVTDEELRKLRERVAEVAKEQGIRPFNVGVWPTRHKRFYLENPESSGVRVGFGSKFYENFLIHGDEARRAAYRKRAEGIRNKRGERAIAMTYSPAWAAYHLLW